MSHSLIFCALQFSLQNNHKLLMLKQFHQFHRNRIKIITQEFMVCLFASRASPQCTQNDNIWAIQMGKLKRIKFSEMLNFLSGVLLDMQQKIAHALGRFPNSSTEWKSAAVKMNWTEQKRQREKNENSLEQIKLLDFMIRSAKVDRCNWDFATENAA